MTPKPMEIVIDALTLEYEREGGKRALAVGPLVTLSDAERYASERVAEVMDRMRDSLMLLQVELENSAYFTQHPVKGEGR